MKMACYLAKVDNRETVRVVPGKLSSPIRIQNMLWTTVTLAILYAICWVSVSKRTPCTRGCNRTQTTAEMFATPSGDKFSG